MNKTKRRQNPRLQLSFGSPARLLSAPGRKGGPGRSDDNLVALLHGVGVPSDPLLSEILFVEISQASFAAPGAESGAAADAGTRSIGVVVGLAGASLVSVAGLLLLLLLRVLQEGELRQQVLVFNASFPGPGIEVG